MADLKTIVKMETTVLGDTRAPHSPRVCPLFIPTTTARAPRSMPQTIRARSSGHQRFTEPSKPAHGWEDWRLYFSASLREASG